MKGRLVYSEELTAYDFGTDHPMAPGRVRNAISLARQLGVLDRLDIVPPPEIDIELLRTVHTDAYIAAVQACAAFDYVISPTSPIPAFAAELPSPTNDPLRPLEHIGFTVPFNMSEQPAASINCGYTSTGLPIGLQIAGKRFDDLGVLQVARAFEQLREPQRPWPLPPSEAIHHVD